MSVSLAGRVASLVTVVGVAAAAVVVARAQPQAVAPALSAVKLPAAARAATAVCPGPETLLVPDGASPADPGGPVVVGAVLQSLQEVQPGQAVPSEPATRWSLTGAQLITGATPGLAVGSSVRTTSGAVTASGDVASAVQLTLGRLGDLRGLAATTCPAAATQTWLVGGGTVTGERARLIVTNPTAVPTVVDVTVLGPDGVVDAPGAQGLTLAAGASSALFLDAVAPGLPALAGKVAARTGRVVAPLHDTLVRGLTPGGVDDVSAAEAASTRQVLPGVVTAAPGTSSVRVVVPGARDAVVRVHLLGTEANAGDLQVADGVLTVPAGTVRDVSLKDVPDGTWTAVVESDVPVLAAARSWVTGPGGEIAGTSQALGKTVPPSELAWTAATPPLPAGVTLAVPPLRGGAGVAAPSATLVLAAPAGAGSVVLHEVDAFGSLGPARSLEVPATGTLEVALGAGTSAIRVERPDAQSGQQPGQQPAQRTGHQLAQEPVHASLLFRTTDKSGTLLSVVPVTVPVEPARVAPVAVQDPALG